MHVHGIIISGSHVSNKREINKVVYEVIASSYVGRNARIIYESMTIAQDVACV